MVLLRDEFGIHVPVIGGLVDRLLRRVLATRLEALRCHMQEEGRNLKRILEETPE